MNTTSMNIPLFLGFKGDNKLTWNEVQQLCGKLHLARSTTKKEYDQRYYITNKDKKTISNRQYVLKHGHKIKKREKERQVWNRGLCGTLGRSGYFEETKSWYNYYSDLFV